MNFDSRFKSIFLALVGIVSIVFYFWLFSHSQAMQLLRIRNTKEEILATAEQAYRQSPLAQYNWRHSLRVTVNDGLFRYVQKSPKGDSAKSVLPIGQWEIKWGGKFDDGAVKVNSEPEKKKKSGSFIVRYNFNGDLIGLDLSLPEDDDSTAISEAAALGEAKNFLAALAVDTASIKLKRKASSQEGGKVKQTFSFTRPALLSSDWDENFLVEILGAQVTKYNADVELHKGVLQPSKFEEVSGIVAMVLAPVTWVVVCVFLLVVFVRRLRHDEIEFKRAKWVGIFTFAALAIMIGIQSWPEWEALVFGGGIGGLFTGAAMVLVYAATESLQRDVWKEKLTLLDLLFRGYGRVKEMGHAILRAFFIAGVTLLLLGGTIWLATRFNLASLEIDNDDLWVFKNSTHIIAALCAIVMSSGFIGLMFLTFWPTYIRSKTLRLSVLIILSGLFFELSGLHLNFLKPSYLALAFFLPIALLWGWFVYRNDSLTILLAIAAVFYFLKFSFITLLPGGFSSTAGLTTEVLVSLFFAAGLYFVFSKNSVAEFENYVPAYVSRIAERERFLKELEIARSIQMRFLPATPPVFPKLDIACLCKPAMEVGGDYYDFIKHDDSRLGVVIGDVSGKGVSAAFFMTMAKGIIKALSRINPSPKSLLSDMNSVFYENTPK
jgi:hypothetical protein